MLSQQSSIGLPVKARGRERARHAYPGQASTSRINPKILQPTVAPSGVPSFPLRFSADGVLPRVARDSFRKDLQGVATTFLKVWRKAMRATVTKRDLTITSLSVRRAGSFGLAVALFLSLAMMLPLNALAQSGFVYVNNQSSSNSVSAYKIGATGTLSQIGGSPFTTGGVGSSVTCYGLTRLAVSPVNNLLFVANTGDRTITPFQINTTTGALTKSPGAPFPSGLTVDSCQGFSLAVTPDGAFLMAASNGEIRTFSAAANGALAFVSSTTNCCSPNSSMAISPDGRFLAVSNTTSVSMYSISAGVLTPVAGSPFAKLGTGSVSALDFSCKADRLYAGEATATTPIAEGWTVDANGVLTPAPKAPFTSSGTNSNVVLYSPDNTLLFQSNQSSSSINSFVVNADGSITNSGKFAGTGQVHTPVGLATDSTGTFLYVADDAFGVAAFRIGDGGVLAALQDLGISRPGQIHDVVSFPPRSCASADVVLALSAIPNPAVAGAPIQYTVNVTNNGPSAASLVVADALPVSLSAGGSAAIANPSGANRTNTISGSNVVGAVTITTTVPHQLFAGEQVTVGAVHAPTTPNPIQSGFFLTDPGFNGVFTVATVPSPTTFTYTQTLPQTSFPRPTLQINSGSGAQRIGGTVTITSSQPFQLAPGTLVDISGVADSSFNITGVAVQSQPTATSFTYLQTGKPDAVSGGGIVTGPRNIPATDTAGGGSMSSPVCQISAGSTGTCGTATFAPHPPIVTAVRSANVVTLTTSVPHQLLVGKTITVQGVANTSFNGTFKITSVPSPLTLTYNQTAANASSTGGAIVGPGIVSQLVTFSNMQSGESRSALITASTDGTTPNGTIITNRATISNMSVVDSVPGDTTQSANVTIGSTGATSLTVPTATGPYGGNAVVTATLIDSSTSAPIAGATIGFNFNQNNSHYNAVTDGSGVATVSVPLGFTTVGTHASAFTATFGGDSTHTGSSATGDLVVTKAQLTVTADNQSRLYGDPNPALTYTITGFVNGDTISVVSGAADCSTTATVTSPVGTYPISCALGTLSAQNYVFVFVDGTLTVNPAPLTVDVANASRAYGDPNPAFTGTITGIKNGDNITATYSTTATILSPVGTYPITATLSDNGTGTLPNYVVTVNNGTLTITPAALVVTANNAARLYGDPNPAFTGTIAGIKNNDNITAIFTTTATPASPVGTYPIIPTLSDNGTGALTNYIVTANNGSLTVSPAPLVVTAADATRGFGQPNPVFTGTIVGIKNNDNITATYSTPATVNSPPGTYPIIPLVSDNGTGVLGNYTVTINNGTLTITAAVLTVTADNASRLYGDPNPVFTGTITGIVNGDNITATYTSVATPASPVGTYPIVPTLSDNGTGALANYQVVIVNGTLTVNPAPLTVTVASLSRFYGDPNPVFTGTITGIKNGDNITATYSSTATQASPVGTYPIVATLVDPDSKLSNYTVTNTPGTLTVNPAPLVVTAANATRLYGDPNPVFTGTITGIKNGDNITAVYATTATVTSPVGTYPITPGLVDPGNKLGNYAVTLNNGTLTIAPAPLTVTAANATRGFGQPNPVFTGTIVGIKNGDNITATYSTPATASSPAGTYPIIPTLSDNGTGALANYSVTVVNGTLTISQATLTVTANNASRLYGDPNPVFTGTITGILNGDNITATYATVADPTSPVGTYAIVPTLSDNGTGALANYTVVVNDGVLTVNPAPLAVTVDSFSRLYGDPNPVFTGSILGIKNGDAISAIFATTADPTSAVGTYPIVATLVDPTNKLGNYTVTINNGTLTINPAPLTVTANNAARLFGTPNPPFSGTLTGVKNSDPITASFSTTATATSPVGTYPITPALADPAGKLGNYTVTSNNGTLTVNAAPTANFVFVNNQAASGNSINGYSVAVDGTLTALAGSPTLTGGLGANAACSSANRLALSAGNNLLFVSNGGDQTISAFSIDPTSGALTAAAGSPFASGLSLDACGGISLAATPDGDYLMASSNGQIKTFSIGAGGVLTAVSTAANSVAPNASMKISANGQFLAVSNGTSVSVYTINADGSLAAVAGSPFAETGSATLAGLDFNSTSGLLFGAEASATASLADAWTVGANGALSAVAGSPFSIGAINSNVVLLSPNDGLLFASNQGSANVSLFGVSAGSLSSLGSFGALHAPVGMATDRSGSLLYVADDTFGVGVFRIGAGSLSQLSDSAISGAGQVQDLVAYPPRMASNADLSVAISASSPSVVAGQSVTYTITVTNNGADPAAATISNVLPAGFTQTSCAATGNGACIGNSGAASFYLLQSGESQTVTLVASISLSVADGTVATDSVSITNASAVDPSAANNSASTDVTVGQPATTTLAVAPASGTYGGSTTLSATLSTPSGPLAGETVSFSLNGTPVGSAVTDASGIASVSAALGTTAAGSYPGGVTASFAGDPNNKPSSGSNSLTVNPASLTITAANASRAYGDPNPALTGTISGIQNGDNITATYSTTATATSPVGTYAIVPTASDNGTGALANYTVTLVNGTLTVNPAVLTVTAANASMVFGDPVPAFAGTITGIRNGENITASFSTTATSASNVGTYPIVPAVSDNGTGVLTNYSVSLVNGTLTITQAPLTVSAANASMIYGDPVPALSGTITGIRNGNNITATYSTTATSASPVGSYPIVPTLSDNGTGALANYSVTSNNGTLTINPAPLTITAANASMIYGDPLPAFSGTITGIKNADNITATYSTVATSASNVGTYAIVPSPSDNGTGALANYTVTLVNGTLTINPAPLSVTADNATRVYGDPNPAFTGTITGLKNGDNITFSATSADATAAVGTYPIVPVLVDPNGKLVNYTVTATNGTLTVTPAPLSVTAANASMVFGDPVPALTGTVSGIKNGDNITGVYATTATSASPVGTYPITASASDNGTGKLTNYTVTPVNATLTINPAPLTVSAANASMVFGDPVPSLSGTITGIKNGNNITASYSTTATSTSPVGTYPIVPTVSDNGTGALANYTLVVNNGTLTINPAPLTVAGTNAAMVFGDPVPAVTGTISGLKNGDNIGATFATPATSASPVGNYAVIPSVTDPNNVLSNYTLSVVNGVLQISPAPLTVTAADASRVFGDPNPVFTGTITGIKNGDNITATYSSATDPTTAVGTYPIVPAVSDNGTGALANYIVTSNNGTLTINPALLTIQANDASAPVGGPFPAFTGTITGLKNSDVVTASYSTTADATSPAGTYPIIPSADPSPALSNYTLSLVNGTLTLQ